MEVPLGGYVAKERRRSVDGDCFLVERMPADHSCGFHGIGIDRETAAALLLQNLDDPEVEAHKAFEEHKEI